MSAATGGDLRRVLALRGERHRGRPALGRRRPRCAASPSRWRRAVGQRTGVGHPPGRAGAPPRRRPERPHLGHRGPGPRPAPGGRRPTRARPLGLARRRPGLDPGAMADDVAAVIGRLAPARPVGGRDVARRRDLDRPGHPAPRAGASAGPGRHHPGGRPQQELRHRRLPGRPRVVRLLRRDPGADHPVQPHPVGVVPAPRGAAQRRAARGRDLDLAPPAGPALGGRRPPRGLARLRLDVGRPRAASAPRCC